MIPRTICPEFDWWDARESSVKKKKNEDKIILLMKKKSKLEMSKMENANAS